MSIFNKKILPDQHDCIVISEDGEPDDIVAEFIIVQAASHHLPILWITGEGKKDKRALALNKAAALGLHYCTILQSDFSEKDFPDDMLTAFGNNVSIDEPKDCNQELTEFVKKYQHPLFIMLKPCMELVRIAEDLKQKITVAAYGSFNFRCMIKGDNTAQGVAKFFNTSFRRVVLFETFFAFGPENNINATIAPKFFETIARKAKAGSKFWQGVVNSIAIWNDHIATDKAESLAQASKRLKEGWQDTSEEGWQNRVATVGKMEMSLKIIKSITDARLLQMVFADFGLAACIVSEGAVLFTNPKQIFQCNISFDPKRGLTQLLENPNGKVFAIMEIDKKSLIAVCEKLIE